MSRGLGFEVADTDTGLMADPKVLALARRLRDATRTGAAVALYDAVRLASWKAGQRLTLEETAPGWWLDPIDELAAALEAVGLIDDEHRIPAHAWAGWYGPAVERKLDVRRSQVYGGLVSHGMSQAEANAEADRRIDEYRVAAGLEPRVTNPDLLSSTSVHPSVRPSVRPVTRTAVEQPTNERRTDVADSGPVRLRETMRAMGLPVPEDAA